jgi:diacylglycerol O-acyltransferase
MTDETWGAATEMNATEALMWRAEVVPRMRSTGVLLELLDSAPDRERMVSAHDWVSREIPRLRQRVVEDPLGLAAPQWVVDDAFDLAYHVRVTRLPGAGTLPELLEATQVIYMAPFDRSRPLWEAVLVEGLADGQAAYVLKLHHSLADGQAIVQLLRLAHSDRAEPGHQTADLPVPTSPPLTGRALAARTLAGAPGWGVRTAVRAGGRLTALAGRAASAPRDSAGAGLDYARSLARVLGPAPSPGSPLFAQRSMRRRLGVIDVPLDALRAAGRAAGGSLNDAFLAALTGGVGRYHEHHGVPLDTLTLALPVSTRKPDDPPGSNRFAGARIAGAASIVDPAERMRELRKEVLAAREEPALDFLGLLSPALSRLPGTLTAPLTAQLTQSIDLQASNIPGLTGSAYLAGARVLRTYPFGALPGPAMMATLMSHEGTCCIGITVDAAAVTDFELMLRCLQEGLDEVCDLASP